MSTPEAPIILFHYSFSPWSQKVTAYLSLRGIPYTSCDQPVTQPRPDMDALGVNYRRIPVLSIGRDVYCDTLLMLEKLDALYPVTDKAPSISGRNPQERTLERLLEKWTDAVVFKYAAAAIPSGHPAMQDKNFTDDRKELWGRDWTAEHQDSLRPEALVVLRSNMQFLEEEVLVDGREWILEGNSPSILDIHSAWIFKWLANDIEGSLPADLFSDKIFPKTYAWFNRYTAAITKAMEKMEADGKVRHIEGKDAVKEMLAGPFGEKNLTFDSQDPTGLKQGENVVGYPQDTGFTRKDKGTLVGLTPQEVVIASKAHDGTEVRVHHPRWNFAIERAQVNGYAKPAVFKAWPFAEFRLLANPCPEELMEDWQERAFSTRHVHNRIGHRGKGKGGKQGANFDVHKVFGTYELKCPASMKLPDSHGKAHLEVYNLNAERNALLAKVTFPGVLDANAILAGSRKTMKKVIEELVKATADQQTSEDDQETVNGPQTDSEEPLDENLDGDFATFEKNSFRSPKFWLQWQGQVVSSTAEMDSDKAYLVFTGNACDKFQGTICCTALGWDNAKITGWKIVTHGARDYDFEWHNIE